MQDTRQGHTNTMVRIVLYPHPFAHPSTHPRTHRRARRSTHAEFVEKCRNLSKSVEICRNAFPIEKTKKMCEICRKIFAGKIGKNVRNLSKFVGLKRAKIVENCRNLSSCGLSWAGMAGWAGGGKGEGWVAGPLADSGGWVDGWMDGGVGWLVVWMGEGWWGWWGRG